MINLKVWDSYRGCINEIRGYVDNGKTIRIFNKKGGYSSYPKDKIVLLQGTRIKDKNGVEVYQGDVVDFNGGFFPHKGEIVYSDKFGAFATKNDKGETFLHNHVLNSFEIIGNRYENPELLKPSKNGVQ